MWGSVVTGMCKWVSLQAGGLSGGRRGRADGEGRRAGQQRQASTRRKVEDADRERPVCV